MTACFQTAPLVDLENKDQIFHTVFDLDERFPGSRKLSCFYTGERGEYDGYDAKWRGIYDDKGRIRWQSAITWI